MIAPAALVLFAVVLLIVIASSLGGGSSDVDKRGGAVTQPSRANRPARERGATGTTVGRRTYVVKSGDTLATIAERTEVPIDRLIALNPTIDPQALVTGQRVKLRE